MSFNKRKRSEDERNFKDKSSKTEDDLAWKQINNKFNLNLSGLLNSNNFNSHIFQEKKIPAEKSSNNTISNEDENKWHLIVFETDKTNKKIIHLSTKKSFVISDSKNNEQSKNTEKVDIILSHNAHKNNDDIFAELFYDTNWFLRSLTKSNINKSVIINGKKNENSNDNKSLFLMRLKSGDVFRFVGSNNDCVLLKSK